ncbi:MAG: peptidase M49 [Acidobacteriota bacterium]
MTARYLLLSCGALTLAMSTACSNKTPTPAPAQPAAAPERRYLLERVDDAAVVQLYADGFAGRPLKDRILMWHLAQAAIAGRDIYYDQQSAHALEMRELIEAVVAHPGSTDAVTLGAIQKYAKLFWINSGPYNNLTTKKFVLTATPEAFAAAVKGAVAAGADVMLAPGETIDQRLTRLQPMFFDPKTAPSVTAKTPPPGQDILTASSNNMYSGVTLADLKTFQEKYPLNSRVVKRNGRLVEEVYRVDGRYDAPIRAVVAHLEAARPYATPAMATALDALIKWYRTGEPIDRKAYDIAWVADKASPVDTINGFTENYVDARGMKGAWEALVFYVNEQKTDTIRKLATDAQWFEDHMPWDPKYRKAGVQGITANAIDVVMETGDSGPVTPIGINLPNDESVREAYGSKSVSLSNVVEAYTKAADPRMRDEFSWTPEEAARTEKWGGIADDMLTNMHEVIGHASGKKADQLKSTPQEALKEYFSALEEGRADMVGLYFIGDPKLVELGIFSAADQGEIQREQYEAYARNALVQLRRVRQGTQIEEDHMRNRQMVVRWLMANTKAIEQKERDGKTFYVVVDVPGFREGIGRLLTEVQRIKSEGDLAAARKLFDTYGIHFDPKLRDQIVARVDALKAPSYTGFVQPTMEVTRNASGEITDVRLSYPLDFTKQMLEYSAATRETRKAFLDAERRH